MSALSLSILILHRHKAHMLKMSLRNLQCSKLPHKNVKTAYLTDCLFPGRLQHFGDTELDHLTVTVLLERHGY